MGKKNKSKKKIVIALAREIYPKSVVNGSYVLIRINDEKISVGAPCTVDKLCPFIDSRSYQYATQSAKRELTSKLGKSKLGRLAENLEEVDLKTYRGQLSY